jgi:hypothetical protein
MAWVIVDVEITRDDLVLATVANNHTTVSFLAYVRIAGRKAYLTGLHIQGVGPNTLGQRGINDLALKFMEALDVDELHIAGAARTSGAGPGRRPLPIIFRRAGRLGAAA